MAVVFRDGLADGVSIGYRCGMNGRLFVVGALTGVLGLAVGFGIWGISEVRHVEVLEKAAHVEPGGLGGFFESWAAREELEGALVGFCVLDEEGEVIYKSPLAEKALCPASALKTLTAGAALGLLGEDFKFETRLLAAGEISAEGGVPGNLILRGGGDPTLAEEDLVRLAEEVTERGVKWIEGSVQVDDSIFPQPPVSDHWVWGDLGNAYGTGAYGVNVGRNVVRLVFDAGAAEGDPASFLRREPDIYDLVEWRLGVNTGSVGSGDQVMMYSTPYGRQVDVRGTVPLGAREFEVRGAVPDPPALARAILERELHERGVEVFGEMVPANLEEVVLARHESAVLADIVDHMHEVSDNLEAQSLFLMMGVKEGKDPEVVLREYWEEMGVDFEGLRLIDGSGLARATMIRPLDLARVSFSARKTEYGETFVESLPVGSGGSIQSKRGAMSGVRTEVGFLSRNGKEYTFALMGNGLAEGVDFWRLREDLLEEVGK